MSFVDGLWFVIFVSQKNYQFLVEYWRIDIIDLCTTGKNLSNIICILYKTIQNDGVCHWSWMSDNQQCCNNAWNVTQNFCVTKILGTACYSIALDSENKHVSKIQSVPRKMQNLMTFLWIIIATTYHREDST